MMMFEKAHNLRVVAVIISMVFLCNTSLYACPVSEDTLRVPKRSMVYQRMKGIIDAYMRRRHDAHNEDHATENLPAPLLVVRNQEVEPCIIRGKKVLAFGPHHDDQALSTGAGIFLNLVGEDNDVRYVTMTHTGSRRADLTMGFKRGAQLKLRHEEQKKEALFSTGNEAVILDLQLGRHPFSDTLCESDITEVVELLRMQKPDVIALPFGAEDLDTHSQHRVTYYTLLEALRRYTEETDSNVNLVLYEATSALSPRLNDRINLFKPLDLEEMKKIMQAIGFHQSQLMSEASELYLDRQEYREIVRDMLGEECVGASGTIVAEAMMMLLPYARELLEVTFGDRVPHAFTYVHLDLLKYYYFAHIGRKMGFLDSEVLFASRGILIENTEELLSTSTAGIRYGATYLSAGVVQRMAAPLGLQPLSHETIKNYLIELRRYVEDILSLPSLGNINRDIGRYIVVSVDGLLEGLKGDGAVSLHVLSRRYMELCTLTAAMVHGQYWQSPSQWTSASHYRGVFQHNTSGGMYERSSLNPALLEEILGVAGESDSQTVLFNDVDSAFIMLLRYLFQSRAPPEGSNVVVSRNMGESWRNQIVDFAHRYKLEISDTLDDGFLESDSVPAYIFLDLDNELDRGLIERLATTSPNVRAPKPISIVLCVSNPHNLSKIPTKELSALGIQFFLLRPFTSAFEGETRMLSLGLLDVIAEDREVVQDIRRLRGYGGSVTWFAYDLGSLLLRGQLDETLTTRDSEDLHFPIRIPSDLSLQEAQGIVQLERLRSGYQRLESELTTLDIPEHLAGFISILASGAERQRHAVGELLRSARRGDISVSQQTVGQLESDRRSALVCVAAIRLLCSSSREDLGEYYDNQLRSLESKYRMLYRPLGTLTPDEQTHDSLLFNSGMGAIETLLHYLYFYPESLLGSGGTMVVGQHIYFGVRRAFQLQRPPQNVRVVEVDETNLENITDAIDEHGAEVVFLDPIANHIYMNVADIKGVIAHTASRKHEKPFYLIVDTALLGAAFQPAELVGDLELPENYYIIVTRSLQKMDQQGLELTAAGEVTVFAGNAENCRRLTEALKEIRESNGSTLAPLSIEEMSMMDISAEALQSRVGTHCQNASYLARHLRGVLQAGQPSRKVHYPGLAGHPEHAVTIANSFPGAPFLYLQLEFDKRTPEDEMMRRRFLEILFEEATKRGVELVRGESFGFDHTRVEFFYNFLGELENSPALVGLRISLGIEDKRTMANLGNAFEAAFSRFDNEIQRIQTDESVGIRLMPLTPKLMVEHKEELFRLYCAIPFEGIPRTIEDMLRITVDPRFSFLAFDRNGRIAGFTTGNPDTTDPETRVYASLVARDITRPETKGLGVVLSEAIWNAARVAGFHFVRFKVQGDKKELQRYYEKLGVYPIRCVEPRERGLPHHILYERRLIPVAHCLEQATTDDVETTTAAINEAGNYIWDNLFTNILAEELRGIDDALPIILDLDFLPAGVQRESLEGADGRRSEMISLIRRNIQRRLRLAGSGATCKIEVTSGEDKDALLARADKYNGRAILITTADKVKQMMDQDNVEKRVKDITAITPRPMDKEGRQAYAHVQIVVAYAVLKSRLAEVDLSSPENTTIFEEPLSTLYKIITGEALDLTAIPLDVLSNPRQSAFTLVLGLPSATKVFNDDQIRQLQKAEKMRLRAA